MTLEEMLARLGAVYEIVTEFFYGLAAGLILLSLLPQIFRSSFSSILAMAAFGEV